MSEEERLLEELTLKDIQVMVRVLYRFLNLAEKARAVLRRYAHTSSSGPFTLEKAVELVLAKRAEAASTEEEEEEETDEEVKKVIQKIKERRRGREAGDKGAR